jgi:hypothetical protein
MTICPITLKRTVKLINFPIGLLLSRLLYGPLLDIVKDRGMIKNKSMYRYCQSPRLLPIPYRMMTEQNWIIEYRAMNLNTWKQVTIEALPSFNSCTIGEMFGILEVKGAAIDASASDSDSPTSAVLSALQSFAPSPHMAIMSSRPT